MKRLLVLSLFSISLLISTNDFNVGTTTGISTFSGMSVDNGFISLGCTVKTKVGEHIGILVCRT